MDNLNDKINDLDLQVEVGEGEEAVLECGVQGLASIHMVCILPVCIYLSSLSVCLFFCFLPSMSVCCLC